MEVPRYSLAERDRAAPTSPEPASRWPCPPGRHSRGATSQPKQTMRDVMSTSAAETPWAQPPRWR